MIPCMGGACASRENCQNYVHGTLKPDQDVSERLCGPTEQITPIKAEPEKENSDGLVNRI